MEETVKLLVKTKLPVALLVRPGTVTQTRDPAPETHTPAWPTSTWTITEVYNIVVGNAIRLYGLNQ